MELALDDLRSDYVQVLKLVAAEGRDVEVRGLRTRELTGVTLVWDDVTAPMLPVGVGRRVSSRLAAVEALSLVGGVVRPELLRAATPDYDRVLVDPRDLHHAAYGPRVTGQLAFVVNELRLDPTTRRAVVTIWDRRDLRHEGDRPCTLTLQFLLRDERLDLITTMRSQDAWLGLAYDPFQFTQLQHTLASLLRCTAGRLVHHLGSLHLYARDLEKVEKLAATPVDELPLAVVSDLAHNTRPLGVRIGITAARFSYAVAVATARRLLDGEARLEDREANPWYDHRVSPLRGCS